MENLFIDALKKSKKTLDLIKFKRDEKLSADEKKFRAYGLKDEQGNFTQIAEDIVFNDLMEKNTNVLLELVDRKEKAENPVKVIVEDKNDESMGEDPQ